MKNFGFTIIEVVLFLAISMALLAVAFAGISGRTQDIYFTDAMRTMESQLNRSVSNVGTGLNLRGDLDCIDNNGLLTFNNDASAPTPGRNRNCVANGVYLTFDSLSPDVHGVQAVASVDRRTETGDGSTGSTIDAILNTVLENLTNEGTKVVPDTRQEIENLWQLEYMGGLYDDGSVTPISDIGILNIRSVDSNREFIFARAGTTDNLTSFSDPVAQGEEYILCFRAEGNRRAAITLGAEGRFQVSFFDERCEASYG